MGIKLKFIDNKTILGLFLLASFVLYGNSLFGDFVYDDYFFVDRPELRRIDHLDNIWFEPMLPNAKVTGLFRPLATFSFAVNLIVFGQNPFTFHLVNVILNGVNGFLIYLLVNKLFKNQTLAFFTSILWIFFPIHTEAVAYIKARDEVMSTTFALISWLFFLKATEIVKKINYKYLFTSSIFFVLAVMSKELIIFSGAVMFLIYLVKDRPKIFDFFKLGFAFSPLVICYIILRIYVLGPFALGVDDIDYAVNPLKREDFPVTFYTGLKILYIYVSKTFFPINLSSTYHLNYLKPILNPLFSWEALVGLFLLFIAFAAIIYKKTRTNPVGIGIIIFFVSYFPFSQMWRNAGDIVGERWVYFSSFGLALILAFGILEIYKKRRKAALSILVGILFLYTAITIPRNKIWLSNEALSMGMIKDAPESIQGYHTMANILLSKGNVLDAKKYLNKAFDKRDDHVPSMILMANVYFREGKLEEAEKLLVKSIQVDPSHAKSYLSLGGIYYIQGKYQKAYDLFDMNIRLSRKPRAAEVAFAAAALTKMGKYEQSTKLVKNLVDPRDIFDRLNYIVAYNYFKLGDISKAKIFFGNQAVREVDLDGLAKQF